LFTTDSFGNIYFPAGLSLASIPATTGTQARVLVPGVNGRISSATVAQLISQSGGSLVSSVFGRTGVVVASIGDYNTDQVTEGEALYFSTSRARKVLSVTTFNTSGPATYDSSTGIINIPQYISDSGSGSGGNYVPLTRTISINGQTADLSVDRAFSVEEMVYPSIGIPLSNGTSWAPSIVNNSANWNTAFSWGNHALAGYLTSFTETDPIWTAEKTNYALKTYVDTSISNLIDTAPTTLDTLNELAAALGDDANFSTTVTDLIGTKEPAITPGTTAQYWRGDKTWQTLPIYNLSLYVPYTGATSNVDLGSFVLSANNLIANGGFNAGRLELKNANAASTIRSGYFVLSPSSTSTSINFGFSTGATTWKSCTFSSHLLTDNTPTIYSLPNGSGTLALTSDIVSYTLPTASATVLGGIKVGSNLSIDANGVLSAGNSYVLPTASASVLGGIKVGTNLSIDANGVLSSTDTNTTYADFTRTVAGLVPNPGGSTTTRYLREDGTWVIPPDTDTVYVHPTTAGNKHIPAGGSAGQILRYSSDGTAVWGADNDTTYSVFTRSADGLTPAAPAGTGTTKYLREDGTWQVPPDTDTDTNTTYSNFTRTVSGLVPNPGGSTTNRYLREDGTWVVPPDTDTDTNTTYTAGTGLTLTGTSFSITKTITASQTADTIALRNGDGQLVATGFFQASSRTLKTNITPFTRSALDIIREVTVVSFNYKTDVINKHIGFIAEDTPEELSTRNKNVMDSNNTIGVLLKAIQELESKVKELEAKCNEK
jgi:hypothetical protein